MNRGIIIMLRVITTSTPQRGEKSSATIQKSIGTVGGETKIAINYTGFVVLLCQKPAPLLHGLETKSRITEIKSLSLGRLQRRSFLLLIMNVKI
jgi:hypothetical protein